MVYTGKNPGKKMPSRPETKMDIANMTSEDLVKMLEHRNEWQRRVAQRLLIERIETGGSAAPRFLRDIELHGKTIEIPTTAQFNGDSPHPMLEFVCVTCTHSFKVDGLLEMVFSSDRWWPGR